MTLAAPGFCSIKARNLSTPLPPNSFCLLCLPLCEIRPHSVWKPQSGNQVTRCLLFRARVHPGGSGPVLPDCHEVRRHLPCPPGSWSSIRVSVVEWFLFPLKWSARAPSSLLQDQNELVVLREPIRSPLGRDCESPEPRTRRSGESSGRGGGLLSIDQE